MEPCGVAFGCLVVAGGQTPPLLDLVDAAFHGVAVLESVASWLTGRPPALPRFLRLALWSAFSGITVRIFRLRRWARWAREEYALSPATASGRVRGRPDGPRTSIFFRTGRKRGLSAACPGVRMRDSGRQRRSAARCTLPVSPPRERPSSAAFSRALRRRRTARRRARSASSPSSGASVTGLFCPVGEAPFPPSGPSPSPPGGPGRPPCPPRGDARGRRWSPRRPG